MELFTDTWVRYWSLRSVMGLCKKTELLSLPAYAGFTRKDDFFSLSDGANSRTAGGDNSLCWYDSLPFYRPTFPCTPYSLVSACTYPTNWKTIASLRAKKQIPQNTRGKRSPLYCTTTSCQALPTITEYDRPIQELEFPPWFTKIGAVLVELL